MSYLDQAYTLNGELKQIDPFLDLRLINAILEFGRVAKYRCRHNSAYATFAQEVFRGIADIKQESRERIRDGTKYTVLVAHPANVKGESPSIPQSTRVMVPCEECGELMNHVPGNIICEECVRKEDALERQREMYFEEEKLEAAADLRRKYGAD